MTPPGGVAALAALGPRWLDPTWLVCLLLTISAVAGNAAGNAAGYGIGRVAGSRLLDRPDGRLWHLEWADRTRSFVDRHGTRAFVLGRFVPVVRTVITAVAGVGHMPPRRFLAYSTLGGLCWAAGVPVLGYLLGGIGVVRDHVELVLVLIVVVSLMPVVVETLRARHGRAVGRAARDVDATNALDRDRPDGVRGDPQRVADLPWNATPRPGAPPSAARRMSAVALAVAAGVWVLVNKPVEGPTLLVLSHQHGITLADLLSVAGLVVAAVVWVAPVRRLARRRVPARGRDT